MSIYPKQNKIGLGLCFSTDERLNAPAVNFRETHLIHNNARQIKGRQKEPAVPLVSLPTNL